MAARTCLKLVHRSQIRRITVDSTLNAEQLYDECAKLCNLQKGKFTLKNQDDFGMKIYADEDLKAVFLGACNRPVKLFISEESVPQDYDHKYDQPSESSMIDLASATTLTDLTSSLDSIKNSSLEFCPMPPIDSSLSFAFVSTNDANAASVSLSRSTELSRKTVDIGTPCEAGSPVTSTAVIVPVSAVQVISEAGTNTSGLGSVTVLSTISHEVSEIRQIVSGGNPETSRLLEVCSTLAASVDTLQTTLQTIREELRQQLSDELVKRISDEVCKRLKLELQIQTDSIVKSVSEEFRKRVITPASPRKVEDESKEMEESLVRLQASTSDPAQLEVLKKLELMGFTNTTFNSVLLETHQGDVDKVLADLRKFYKLN